jgi:hypothetical protein
MDDSVYCDMNLYVSAVRAAFVVVVVIVFLVCDASASFALERRTHATTRAIDTNFAP